MNTFVITTLHFNVLYHSLVQITREYRRISNPFFFKSKHMAACKNI